MFITGGTKNNHAPEAKGPLPFLLKPLPQFPQALLTVHHSFDSVRAHTCLPIQIHRLVWLA